MASYPRGRLGQAWRLAWSAAADRPPRTGQRPLLGRTRYRARYGERTACSSRYRSARGVMPACVSLPASDGRLSFLLPWLPRDATGNGARGPWLRMVEAAADCRLKRGLRRGVPCKTRLIGLQATRSDFRPIRSAGRLDRHYASRCRSRLSAISCLAVTVRRVGRWVGETLVSTLATSVESCRVPRRHRKWHRVGERTLKHFPRSFRNSGACVPRSMSFQDLPTGPW